MASFNEIMSVLDINQVKHLFEDEDILIEVLSVQIDMISRQPEYQTGKRSIRRFLHKQKRRLQKVKREVYGILKVSIIGILGPLSLVMKNIDFFNK